MITEEASVAFMHYLITFIRYETGEYEPLCQIISRVTLGLKKAESIGTSFMKIALSSLIKRPAKPCSIRKPEQIEKSQLDCELTLD